jgi:SAM-dependent methyltransferase
MPAHAETGRPRSDRPAEPLRLAVERCARGETPPNVALMQILMAAEAAPEARDALHGARASLQRDGETLAARRLGRVLDLWARTPQAAAVIDRVLNLVRHDPSADDDIDAAIARCAAMFDAAAPVCPEASVALYALGDPGLLAQATAEIIARMRAWELLGRDRDLLDIGCGIGRFVEALAPQVRRVVGIDIAPAMIEIARQRCRHHGNVELVQSSGRDLAMAGSAGFDLVYAVDTFPYLVQAGGGLAARHLQEAARVLRPGGALLILNFSYRGDAGADRAEVSRLAAACGFALRRHGTRDLSLWDGVTFLLQREP